MTKKTYGNVEIQHITGLSKIQIIHWTQIRAVKPLIDVKGRGQRRVYSFQNLIEFMICREMARYKIESSFIIKALDYLRSDDCCDYVLSREKHPHKLKLCSFWELLEREPQTDKTKLIIKYDSKKSEFVFVIMETPFATGLFDIMPTMKNAFSMFLIDLRTLINEVQLG